MGLKSLYILTLFLDLVLIEPQENPVFGPDYA